MRLGLINNEMLGICNDSCLRGKVIKIELEGGRFRVIGVI